MNMIFKNYVFHRKIFLSTVCALCMSVVFSGCSPVMRKKFIRKKKQEANPEDAIIPVLEPQDYPEPVYNRASEYKKAYALLQIWQKDLLQIFRDDAGDKQMLGRMEQMDAQLILLQDLLRGTASEKFVEECLKKVAALRAYYGQPQAFRQRAIIEKRIMHLGKDIRENLSYEKVKKDLKAEL